MFLINYFPLINFFKLIILILIIYYLFWQKKFALWSWAQSQTKIIILFITIYRERKYILFLHKCFPNKMISNLNF